MSAAVSEYVSELRRQSETVRWRSARCLAAVCEEGGKNIGFVVIDTQAGGTETQKQNSKRKKQ